MENNYELVKFIDDDFFLDVNVDYQKDTVWLDQEQMAILFDVDRTRIVRHIANIYSDNELDKDLTCAENAQVQIEGNRQIERKIKFYNLDMIISVGYRVKSKRGILFRKWASTILKNYLIDGYAVNSRRMSALNKTIEIQNKMLAHTLDIDELSLTNVIREYTSALDLLDDYDHQRLTANKGNKEIKSFNYEEVRNIIDSMKFNETSNLFGIEKEKGKLDGIIQAINQTAFGEDIYKTLEEKAANLLYFLIKDHPFIDGCKRIAATLFLEYLNRNHALIKNGQLVLSNDAVCAITILTAESKPEEKDVMVKVIMKMLNK